jgi:cytochrome P450
MDEVAVERYDPYHPDALRSPYRFYRRLRAEDPVHWGVSGEPGRPGTWYLLRYHDVVAALKDQRLGREVEAPGAEVRSPADAAAEELRRWTRHWMILRDPPAHTRLRALVNKAFTPRMAERVEPRIAGLAERLVDAVSERGRMDVIADFGRLLPVLVIAEVLGVPPEDHGLFAPWAIALAPVIDLRQTPEVRRRGAEAMGNLIAYLREVIARRRRDPSDDLLSGLLAAEDGGGRLHEDEILGTIMLLLTAGNDPTTYMLGNFVLTLLEHPDALERLQGTPELAERAADELLRYDTSVQMTFRFALRDVEYGGRQIRAGDHLALVFGSALRDPAYTPDPDRLDLERANNRVPYGMGIHFCLGASLARAQGRIGLETLVRRLKEIELDTGRVEHQPAAAVRGPSALPIRFTPR